MVDKNSDLMDDQTIVYCKDCISNILKIGGNKDCEYFHISGDPKFFCKFGIRKIEPKKEIARNEKIDAIIRRIDAGHSLNNCDYFYRENGIVFIGEI